MGQHVVIFAVFMIAISVVASVLENVFTDRKFRRGLLIGGGSTILVLGAAFLLH